MQQVEDKQLGFHLSDAHLEARFSHQRALMNLAISALFSLGLIGLGLAFLIHHDVASWADSFGAALTLTGAVIGANVLWRVMVRGDW